MPDDHIHHESIEERQQLARVAGYAIGTLALTTVHHAYGAYAFGALWRLHVAVVSVPIAGAVAIAYARYRRGPRGTLETISFYTVVGLTLVAAVAFFGGFEGAYNHVLKDAFYLADAPPRVIQQLFPRPTYEPPTDLFFEVTGILHVVPAALAAIAIWRLLRAKSTVSVIRHAA